MVTVIKKLGRFHRQCQIVCEDSGTINNLTDLSPDELEFCLESQRFHNTWMLRSCNDRWGNSHEISNWILTLKKKRWEGRQNIFRCDPFDNQVSVRERGGKTLFYCLDEILRTLDLSLIMRSIYISLELIVADSWVLWREDSLLAH